MSEPGQGSEYELQPPIPPSDLPPPLSPTPAASSPITPKPGEPGWVPPVPIIEKADPTPDPAPAEPAEDPDIQKHKGIAVLGYLVFLLPLIIAPNSKFARFHANQGLLLFILWCVAIMSTILLTIGWEFSSHYFDKIVVLQFFFGCFAHLLPIALLLSVLALTIVGIIHAANGELKELPLFGRFTLIRHG